MAALVEVLHLEHDKVSFSSNKSLVTSSAVFMVKLVKSADMLYNRCSSSGYKLDLPDIFHKIPGILHVVLCLPHQWSQYPVSL